MKRKVIAIDIDDVIADSTESLRLRVNERMGVNLLPEHYRIRGEYWGYYERVWSGHGLKKGIKLDDFETEMVDDQSHVPLLPSVSFAISELAKRFDIVAITARNPDWEVATLRWLDRHFSDEFTGIHFAGNKHDATSKTKGQLAKTVGASFLIDDNPGHCQSAIDEGLEAILFGDYGWHFDAPKQMIRCKDWPAVLDYFNGIE